LFTQYDRDRSGVLEGHEYQSLINDVKDFMVDDFRKQGYACVWGGMGLCSSAGPAKEERMGKVHPRV